MKRLHDLIDHWAGKLPERTCIIDDDGSAYTFGELHKASVAAAACLAERGATGGDRILLVVENSYSAICFALAASRLDCWITPVNARMSAHEIARVAAHADPAVMIFCHTVSREARNHAGNYSAGPISGPFGSVRIASKQSAQREEVHVDPREQVAALFYTTGTTGPPKGVMLTHFNLLNAGRLSAQVRNCGTEDMVLCTAPLTHVFGFVTIVLGALSAGARLQLMARFDEADVLTALSRGVTYFPAVPMMHARILDYAGRHNIKQVDAPSLKYVSAGSAPLDQNWKRRAEQFYGQTLNNGYGITETSAGIATTLPQSPVRGMGVGPVIPGHEVRIVPALDQSHLDNDIGEVLIRGPNVMKGYYKNPEATSAALDGDGFFHTGDLGRLDLDGTLEIAGRIKELIIRSGFNVYPPEVEAALTTHESVLIAAVIGHQLADANEDVLAFVEPVPGNSIDEQALKTHARRRLAPYKVPTRIFIVASLPKADSGKILKARLAKTFSALINAPPAQS